MAMQEGKSVMNPRFRAAVDSLPAKLAELTTSKAHHPGGSLPKRGVYLFSYNGEHLYVGRSNRIGQRYNDHCKESSDTNKAAFAILLACDELQWKRDYKKGSRQRRDENPAFQASFARAKAKIREMEFRAVEECDPTRQALLEIYCAIALSTRHNSFENH